MSFSWESLTADPVQAAKDAADSFKAGDLDYLDALSAVALATGSADLTGPQKRSLTHTRRALGGVTITGFHHDIKGGAEFVSAVAHKRPYGVPRPHWAEPNVYFVVSTDISGKLHQADRITDPLVSGFTPVYPVEFFQPRPRSHW
jgi:hypothetical protein